MWRWQPRKLPKKYQFLGKLSLVFFSMHCIVLAAVFFIDGDNSMHTIHVGRTQIDSNAKIVFCPLQKTVQQKSKAFTQKGTQKVSASKARKKVVEPKSAKKTTLRVDKPKQKKKAALPVKKKTAKKNKPKKAVSKPVPKKPKLQETPAPKKAKQPETEVDAADEHIVYMGRDDMKMHRIGMLVQAEIERHWSPPPGLQKGLNCTVKMRVLTSGKVEAHVDTASGVIVHDISARDAVLACKLPKSLWGKSFLVVL